MSGIKMVGVSELGKVSQRKSDGRWMGRYSLDGQKKYIYGKTRKQVKADFDEIVREYEKAKNITDNASNIENDSSETLLEFLEYWLENYVKDSVSKSTYTGYEAHVRLHVKDTIGDVKLSELKLDSIQKLINIKRKGGRADKIKGGLSAKTIKNIVMMLSAACEIAIEEDKMIKNPTKKLKYQPVIPKMIVKLIPKAKQHLY